MNITASHPRVNEISTLDFHRGVLPRTATIDAHNVPVAQISDRGTRVSVVVKEGTGANTARTPDTETNELIMNSLILAMITPFRNLSSKKVLITLL